MNIFKGAVLSILIGLFICVVAPKVHAAEYLGEFCWGGENGTILLLAVTHMGDQHYIVHGRITENDGDVLAVNGNAEIVGGQVIMHLSSSGSNAGDFWISEDRLMLDLPSLEEATLESIGHKVFNKSTGQIIDEYEYSTRILRAPCQ